MARLWARVGARQWLMLVLSVAAIYWLQPLTPIRYFDFWFPTAALGLTVWTWAATGRGAGTAAAAPSPARALPAPAPPALGAAAAVPAAAKADERQATIITGLVVAGVGVVVWVGPPLCAGLWL